MSWQATTWVTKHSCHKGSALLTMLMLANHAGAEGGDIFPGLAQLAADTRMSKRQVMRIIDKLIASGELVRIEGRSHLGTYQYDMPGVRGDKVSPASEVTSSEPKVTSDSAQGDISDEQGDIALPRTEPELSLRTTQHLEPSLDLAAAPRPRAEDEIWDVLEKLFGPAPKEPKRRKAWGEVAKSLRADGATPTTLRAWVGSLRQTDRDWAVCTIFALAKHYHRLGPSPGSKYGRETAVDGARQVLAEGGDPEMLAAVLQGRKVGNGSNGSARPGDEAPKGLPQRQDRPGVLDREAR